VRVVPHVISVGKIIYYSLMGVDQKYQLLGM